MTIIKKQFQEIHSLLLENKNRKVSTILADLEELMKKKKNVSGQESCFHKVDGQVVAIFCYYHKKWELIEECEYGTKKGTATGFNTMCKEGVSKWTKQQRIRKADESGLLSKLINGELETTDIGEAKEAIFEASKLILAREDGHGYESLEDLLN